MLVSLLYKVITSSHFYIDLQLLIFHIEPEQNAVSSSTRNWNNTFCISVPKLIIALRCLYECCTITSISLFCLITFVLFINRFLTILVGGVEKNLWFNFLPRRFDPETNIESCMQYILYFVNVIQCTIL